MRFLAFALLATAAFDWPAPWLDRLGAAALGLGFLALAVGAASSGVRRALPFGLSPSTAVAPDDLGGQVNDVLARLAPYSLSGKGSD